MLSHAIKVKQNGHSKNAFSWRWTLFLLITIRFKTNMRNISYYTLDKFNCFRGRVGLDRNTLEMHIVRIVFIYTPIVPLGLKGVVYRVFIHLPPLWDCPKKYFST